VCRAVDGACRTEGRVLMWARCGCGRTAVVEQSVLAVLYPELRSEYQDRHVPVLHKSC
jgi:hypothetical protein